MTEDGYGLRCPQCGALVKEFRNPFPTADIIIEQGKGIVLILRRNEPQLWAIPGGYCDYGESLEQAAVREAREETGLTVELIEQFHTYSDPRRDPRQHNITTVYIARAIGGVLKAQDDAQDIGVFSEADLPAELAFDHDRILKDYFLYKKTGQRRTLGTAGAEGGPLASDPLVRATPG
ncbi:MAG: NUDIX hydrolase [Deltaproteobacteria bacterium]|nr:NUDIX hydrolase [Deltaproteobacteria bacterium]